MIKKILIPILKELLIELLTSQKFIDFIKNQLEKKPVLSEKTNNTKYETDAEYQERIKREWF